MNKPYRYVRTRIFGEKGDPIVVQRVGRQKVFPPHEHDFFEVVLVVGGSGYQETAAKLLPIRRGTLTVLRPGHWHAYLKCRGLVIYNCYFGPELLRRELSWLIDEPKLAWLLWGKQEGREEADPLIFNLEVSAVTRLKNILDDFRRTSDASYGMKISCLSLFLTTLAGELPLAPGGETGKVPPAVLRSIRLVEADLSKAWTIRDLAGECGCSPEYLIRLFRSAIGMTPYAYINRCRAELAARLLLRTSATVAEIGEKVGWGEPCHFSRRFKRHYGSSATAYRAKMNKS